MMASALVCLARLYKGCHWHEYLVYFSPLTVDEIFGIDFEKIMIFEILLFFPVSFLIIGVFWSVLSNSLFLLLEAFLVFQNIDVYLFSTFLVEVVNIEVFNVLLLNREKLSNGSNLLNLVWEIILLEGLVLADIQESLVGEFL